MLDAFLKAKEHTRQIILKADTKFTEAEKLEKGKEYEVAKRFKWQKKINDSSL